jgi:hypothetical protein
MKIQILNFLENKNNTYLNGPVLLKTPRNRIKTNFILDTGSPETIISYRDALRLQIPFNSLSKGKILSFAGRKFQGYIYERLKFIFLRKKINSTKNI